ncbi:alpha/beta-hydrolase [Myriangium duriaei CBS 260.36]|uniref:Alpha/beta-hydrolase n=1 Tax=Myriangium duriaei CBS 260.36 TaxID=1168546 RepID=A0A9P4J720_9PEZI|nr:alpha/beta-hydrolase [Myriangium duriaei CBS 260.36]
MSAGSDSHSTAPPGGVSSKLLLPDGRELGYAEFGSPTGRPIILHHGLACSRLDGAFFHEVAQEVGARIIGIDRPGMGWSSYYAEWQLLDFAKDVERLTDHLKLQEYCVMGMSGGGPSVLACAKALPSTKLKAAAMVCALGPNDIGMHGAQFANRIGFSYALRFCPTFLFRWFWHRDPIGRVDLSDDERFNMILNQVESSTSIPKKDREVLTDRDFMYRGLASTRQGFSQNVDFVLRDAILDTLDFGFKVEDIRPDLPVHLWYAENDRNVPKIHGWELKKRLGSRARLHMLDETHASLAWNWKKVILEDLLQTM